MNSRDLFLNQFRGTTLGEISNQSSEEEAFQNTTLRPILKLQNDLIIATFQFYLIQNNIPFTNYSLDKKMNVIEVAILKDIQFQNTLKGIVLGLFTLNEYTLYSKNTSGYNKRIRSMLIERLKSQLLLL
jgi:hypothetical protein